MGVRREVSIISHRPVTRNDLQQERSFFRGSVSTFCNWLYDQEKESSHLLEFLSASYVSFEQRKWDSVTHYMCASTDVREVLSDNNSHGMAKFVH